jgi:hypothetical protein
MGGTRRPEVNRASNLIHLDTECHLWIEHNRTAARERKLLLPDGADPRREPVRLQERGEKTYLDNAGGFTPPPTCTLQCAAWTSDDPCDCPEGPS